MAKPDFTTQDAATYKTNIDLEVGYLYDTGLVSATGDAILKKVDAAGTVVNYLEAENAISGNDPTLRANGTDTNIDLKLEGKGNGGVYGTVLEHPDGVKTFSSNYLSFASIPAWAKKLTFSIEGMSHSAASQSFFMQLGDAALESTGYTGRCLYVNGTAQGISGATTASWNLTVSSISLATDGLGGHIIMTKQDDANNEWVMTAQLWTGSGDWFFANGVKATSAAMSVCGFSTGGTYDGGTISLLMEG